MAHCNPKWTHIALGSCSCRFSAPTLRIKSISDPTITLMLNLHQPTAKASRLTTNLTGGVDGNSFMKHEKPNALTHFLPHGGGLLPGSWSWSDCLVHCEVKQQLPNWCTLLLCIPEAILRCTARWSRVVPDSCHLFPSEFVQHCFFFVFILLDSLVRGSSVKGN